MLLHLRQILYRQEQYLFYKMKKYLLILIATFIGLTAFSQTLPILPAGAKPYGNQLYIVPNTGLVYGGNAGYQYRVIGTKQYVDSLISLGYKKTQIDSIVSLTKKSVQPFSIFSAAYSLKDYVTDSIITLGLYGNSIFNRLYRNEMSATSNTANAPPYMYRQNIGKTLLDSLQYPGSNLNYFPSYDKTGFVDQGNTIPPNSSFITLTGTWSDLVDNDFEYFKQTSSPSSSISYAIGSGYKFADIIVLRESTGASNIDVTVSVNGGAFTSISAAGLTGVSSFSTIKPIGYLTNDTQRQYHVRYKGLNIANTYEFKLTYNGTGTFKVWGVEAWARKSLRVITMGGGGNTSQVLFGKFNNYVNSSNLPIDALIMEYPILNDSFTGAGAPNQTVRNITIRSLDSLNNHIRTTKVPTLGIVVHPATTQPSWFIDYVRYARTSANNYAVQTVDMYNLFNENNLVTAGTADGTHLNTLGVSTYANVLLSRVRNSRLTTGSTNNGNGVNLMGFSAAVSQKQLGQIFVSKVRTDTVYSDKLYGSKDFAGSMQIRSNSTGGGGNINFGSSGLSYYDELLRRWTLESTTFQPGSTTKPSFTIPSGTGPSPLTAGAFWNDGTFLHYVSNSLVNRVIVDETASQVLQNKNLTNSNNVLGKVTMSLGSDVDGDIYYRNSNQLTRLGIGTQFQVLGLTLGKPTYVTLDSTRIAGLRSEAYYNPLYIKNQTAVTELKDFNLRSGKISGTSATPFTFERTTSDVSNLYITFRTGTHNWYAGSRGTDGDFSITEDETGGSQGFHIKRGSYYVGLGVTTPTARLEILGGSATANTGGLKLGYSSALPTVAENGLITTMSGNRLFYENKTIPLANEQLNTSMVPVVTDGIPNLLKNSTISTTELQLLDNLTGVTGSGNLVASVSPTLTGTPLTPTASTGTNTTQVSSTAFVQQEILADRIVNTTTTALSSATLNSTYPNVKVGYRVICHLITGAPTIYTKATENGTSDVWLTTTATITP